MSGPSMAVKLREKSDGRYKAEETSGKPYSMIAIFNSRVTSDNNNRENVWCATLGSSSQCLVALDHAFLNKSGEVENKKEQGKKSE